jgi:adenylate cyclase
MRLATLKSHGVPRRIHVTEAVVRALSGEFRFEERGTTDIKGLGEMRTYFLVGRA